MTHNNPTHASTAGHVTLGDDLTVNRLGYGAMQLTGRGVWGESHDSAKAIQVLRRAIELGVNFIDTADSYGPEVSERLIAEALHPYPEGLVIATKGGFLRPGPDRWHPDGRPEHLRAALEGSLKRLKLDRVDLYQLHAPDPRVPYEESVGALAEMQAEGLIWHIGVSNVTVAQIERARKVAPIVSVQNLYNLADRSSEDVLEYCERDGLAFIPWYPLAAGPLTRRGGALDRVAAHHGATPAQLALAWLLHRSPMMLPIPGTSSITHLEENVAAARIQLNDEEMASLTGLTGRNRS